MTGKGQGYFFQRLENDPPKRSNDWKNQSEFFRWLEESVRFVFWLVPVGTLVCFCSPEFTLFALFQEKGPRGKEWS
jgi:hypothetical protein